MGCNGERRLHPPVTFPYCTNETAPAAVVSVDYLFSESGYTHQDIVWNLISLKAGGKVLSFNGPGRWSLPRGVPVFEYQELVVAETAIYPGAPGHFFNEILPLLLHLDAVLPLRVPLLWPDGDLPGQILRDFQAAGILTSAREYVTTQSPRIHHAKRMYTYWSEFGPGDTPALVLLSQVELQASIRRHIAATVMTSDVHNWIVVLTREHRGRARSVSNQGELLEALKTTWPTLKVDAFEQSEDVPFFEVAWRVYQAAIVMGPHGANSNNIFGARSGTLMIEFGYSGDNMPSDYFCLKKSGSEVLDVS